MVIDELTVSKRLLGLARSAVTGLGVVYLFPEHRRNRSFMEEGRARYHLEREYLQGVVNQLATEAGMTPPKVIVERGSSAAACITTFRGEVITASIGLIHDYSPRTLRAAVGHELSHIRHHDQRFDSGLRALAWFATAIPVLVGDVLTAAQVPLGSMSLREIASLPFSVAAPAVLGAFVSASLYQPVKVATNIALFKLRRRSEFRADREGAYLTRDPSAARKYFESVRQQAIDQEQNRPTSLMFHPQAPPESRFRVLMGLVLGTSDFGAFVSKAKTRYTELCAKHPSFDERISVLLQLEQELGQYPEPRFLKSSKQPTNDDTVVRDTLDTVEPTPIPPRPPDLEVRPQRSVGDTSGRSIADTFGL